MTDSKTRTATPTERFDEQPTDERQPATDGGAADDAETDIPTGGLPFHCTGCDEDVRAVVEASGTVVDEEAEMQFAVACACTALEEIDRLRGSRADVSAALPDEWSLDETLWAGKRRHAVERGLL